MNMNEYILFQYEYRFVLLINDRFVTGRTRLISVARQSISRDEEGGHIRKGWSKHNIVTQKQLALI